MNVLLLLKVPKIVKWTFKTFFPLWSSLRKGHKKNDHGNRKWQHGNRPSFPYSFDVISSLFTKDFESTERMGWLIAVEMKVECFETVVGCQDERYVLSLCTGVFTESMRDWYSRVPESRSLGLYVKCEVQAIPLRLCKILKVAIALLSLHPQHVLFLVENTSYRYCMKVLSMCTYWLELV